MRKRFGAIHSETEEEFIQLAKKAWNKDLLFYEENTDYTIKSQLKDFDYDENETTTTDHSDDLQIETQSIKILILDSENNSKTLYQFCGQTQYKETSFDYISKTELICNKELIFQFWINNIQTQKYSTIIDVYLKNCDVLIFNTKIDSNFETILSDLKPGTKVFKIKNLLNRTQSFKTLSQVENDVQIVKSLQEALSKITSQYI